MGIPCRKGQFIGKITGSDSPFVMDSMKKAAQLAGLGGTDGSVKKFSACQKKKMGLF